MPGAARRATVPLPSDPQHDTLRAQQAPSFARLSQPLPYPLALWMAFWVFSLLSDTPCPAAQPCTATKSRTPPPSHAQPPTS